MHNELIERLQYIADSPDREHGGFHPEVVQTARDAIAELTAVREFVASLNFPIRTKRGDIYDRPNGKCRAVNQDFKHIKGVFRNPVEAFAALGGVASGDNALEAVENFQKLPAGEGGGEI